MSDSHQEPEPSAAADAASHRLPPASEQSRKLAFEFLVVFVLFIAPRVITTVTYIVSPWESQPQSFRTEVYGLASDLGGIGLLLYFACAGGRNLRLLGLRPTRWWKEMIWGVLILWAAWFSGFYAALVNLPLGLETWPEDYTTVEDALLMRGIWPLGLLVSAFFEEVLFRAYLWNRLSHFTGRPLLSLFLCAGLFAFSHTLSPASLLGHFIYALILGAFFWLGRSTPRLVLAHWVGNLAIISGSGHWVAPSGPVMVVSPEYLTIRPVSDERSEIYTVEAADPSSGERLYASEEILLDLTHLNCSSARVERSEIRPEEWSVAVLLTPNGQRACAVWSAERIGERIGTLVEGKLVLDSIVLETLRGPQIHIVSGLSRQDAQRIRDRIQSGGRPP